MTDNPMRLECKNCGLIQPAPDRMIGYVCANCDSMDFATNRVKPVCDFCCLDLPIVASFPAKDFSVPMPVNGPGANSIGWWAACSECRDLVVAGKRDELAERSADSFISKGEFAVTVPRNELVGSVRMLHDQFWNAREGEVIDHGEVPAWPEK